MDFGQMMNIGRNIFQDAYKIYRDRESDKQLQHAEDMAHAQDLRNYERQKEFAQMGIQWRVQDAQAAGLHPVFALSGGGAAYSPGAIQVGDSVSGSDFSSQDNRRSSYAADSEDMRFTRDLQNMLLMAQIRRTNAEAAAIAGQGGSNRLGPAQVGPGIPPVSGDLVSSADQAKVNPAEAISADREDFSRAASIPSPMFERFTVKGADGQDVIVRLPSSGRGTPSEALESISESLPLLWAVFQDNLRENPNLIYDLRHMIPGAESMFKYGTPLARALERTAQWYLNQKKGQAAATRMLRESGLYDYRHGFGPGTK